MPDFVISVGVISVGVSTLLHQHWVTAEACVLDTDCTSGPAGSFCTITAHTILLESTLMQSTTLLDDAHSWSAGVGEDRHAGRGQAVRRSRVARLGRPRGRRRGESEPRHLELGNCPLVPPTYERDYCTSAPRHADTPRTHLSRTHQVPRRTSETHAPSTTPQCIEIAIALKWTGSGPHSRCKRVSGARRTGMPDLQILERLDKKNTNDSLS